MAATGDRARIQGLQVTGLIGDSNAKGIELGNVAVVINSAVVDTITSGSATGITCSTDCMISHSVVSMTANGSGVSTTGISAGAGGLVEENSVIGASLNGGATTGLVLGTSTGYGENVVVNTTTNVSGGTNMGKNVCNPPGLGC